MLKKVKKQILDPPLDLDLQQNGFFSDPYCILAASFVVIHSVVLYNKPMYKPTMKQTTWGEHIYRDR